MPHQPASNTSNSGELWQIRQILVITPRIRHHSNQTDI
jgi:hypothetical protein